MTTCTPIRPFRCWQYRKDSTEPVPEWADKYSKYRAKRSDGDWVVETIYGTASIICWYTKEEFTALFKVVIP